MTMFCPECKAEYRDGFTRCSDCDVDLVAGLPEAPPEPQFESFKSVWTGKDQGRCVDLCKKLRAVGIPFKVDQRTRQCLNAVDEHYKIRVPGDCFNKARKIIKRLISA